MPIVFEEVTGEIVPEHPAEARDAGEAEPARRDDGDDKLRRTLALMRERQRRLTAD
jgi:hypothetical protein